MTVTFWATKHNGTNDPIKHVSKDEKKLSN
jgi:hypothetical protein